jgi:2'-5' RNA ligase
MRNTSGAGLMKDGHKTAVAVTLCLDAASAARVEDMCGVLAMRGISDYAARLGYRPHVTLVHGENIETAAAVSVLRDFAAALERLSVRLNAVSVFPGDTSVLWLDLADDPALHEAQAALHKAISPLLNGEIYSAPGTWIPHVTLAEGLSETAFSAAKEALLPSFMPITAELDRLELVRFPPVHVEWGAPLLHVDEG